MADKPANERTEQPTQRKLKKAGEEGQVPMSMELTSAVSIIVLLVSITLMAPKYMDWFKKILKQGFSADLEIFANQQVFMKSVKTGFTDFLLICLPIFIALFIGSVLAGIALSGVKYSPKAIKPKLSSLNPITGFKNLVNAKSMVKLLISIVKLLFIGIILWVYIQNKSDVLETLRWQWTAQIFPSMAKLIFGMMIRVCIALVIIASADAAFQKWKHIHDLKMTKQEIKDELKDTEGSPEIKKRILQTQLKMALNRMRQEVPKADVILVNPTHVAVALKYDGKTMASPTVVAKGADYVAEKIREIARAYGVPIIRRPELARNLYKNVKVGEPIPQTLYVAVAEVLALIYRLKHRRQISK
jgi:flagellar biosynthetic protein FlhB